MPAHDRRLSVLSQHLADAAASTKYTADDGSEVDFAPFIGVVTGTAEDVATKEPLQTMACIFDRPDSDLQLIEQGIVPRGWLYDIGGGIFLRDHRPEPFLREDGLPGGPSTNSGGGEQKETMVSAMRKLGLTRTMFGGIKFKYYGDIVVGDQLRAEESCEALRVTQSSSGDRMAIDTTIKRYFSGDKLVLEQANTGVTKAALPPGAKDPGSRQRPQPPADTIWEKIFTPTEVALFSYSAVTFNRHRIHYDSHWAEEVEGYPGLVVHGPFTMQLLIDFVRDNNPGRVLAEALFVNQPIKLVGKPDAENPDRVELWAVAPDGTIAQQASAIFA